MSIQQCEECRLALVRVVFDPDAGESDAWSCQLDDTFSEQTREVACPFFVAWSHTLPPPARSCKKSQGKIDGCSTSGGSCGSCGSGGCGSGGCGMGDPAEALDAKWDPEAVDEVDAATVEAWRTAPDVPDHAHHHEEEPHDHDHDHDHDHGPEKTPEPPPATAPGVHGDPSYIDGRAEEPPDDGFPTEAKASCATACGALKALDRMGLGSDESAPVPVPLDED